MSEESGRRSSGYLLGDYGENDKNGSFEQKQGCLISCLSQPLSVEGTKYIDVLGDEAQKNVFFRT